MNKANNKFFKKVAIVVDTPGWFDPFSERLKKGLIKAGHIAVIVRDYEDVPRGDIAFYLSCTRLTPKSIRTRNGLNLVVHASDLPKGRGFSPLVWEILSGVSELKVTMIEMGGKADTGDIVLQNKLRFEGHELNQDLRSKLGNLIVKMCTKFCSMENIPLPRKQSGTATWYRRRNPEDSKLDPQKSIISQFNTFRIVDNERYPAFFDHLGYRYVLRIEKQSLDPIKMKENENEKNH